MMYNSERQMALCLGLSAIVLFFAAWLLFPVASSPAARLAFAFLWLGFVAVPTVLYLRLLRESFRRRGIVHAEEELRARLLAILEATPDLIAINDMRGNICYFNKAGQQMLGLKDTDRLALNAMPSALPGFDPTEVADELFPIGLEEGHWHGEKTLQLADGGEIQVSQVVIAHTGQDGKLAYLSTIARDITKRKQLEEQLQRQLNLIREQKAALEFHQAELEQRQQDLELANVKTAQTCVQLEEANRALQALATTDGLTGLNNHRAFQQKLAEEVERGARYHTPLSMLLLDVDRFKQYNDTFGHPAGDEILKQLARILQANARSADFVGRYGGEEFVLILPATDEEGAVEAAERVRAAVEQALWDRRAITVSIGVASLSLGAETPAQMVDEADKALYLSKAQGRNCVTHYRQLRECAVTISAPVLLPEKSSHPL